MSKKYSTLAALAFFFILSPTHTHATVSYVGFSKADQQSVDSMVIVLKANSPEAKRIFDTDVLIKEASSAEIIKELGKNLTHEQKQTIPSLPYFASSYSKNGKRTFVMYINANLMHEIVQPVILGALTDMTLLKLYPDYYEKTVKTSPLETLKTQLQNVQRAINTMNQAATSLGKLGKEKKNPNAMQLSNDIQGFLIDRHYKKMEDEINQRIKALSNSSNKHISDLLRNDDRPVYVAVSENPHNYRDPLHER